MGIIPCEAKNGVFFYDDCIPCTEREREAVADRLLECIEDLIRGGGIHLWENITYPDVVCKFFAKEKGPSLKNEEGSEEVILF